MDQDIKAFVESCDSCQRKEPPQPSHELYPIPIEGPFDRWGIDFMGPLPLTGRGNLFIIVGMDYFTKWPVAKAVPINNHSVVAEFIFEEIICRFGCPKSIQSDQGSHFKNRWIPDLANRFGINYDFSTVYHPQSNGLVERFNRTLGTALAKFAHEDIHNWDQHLHAVLFAYRTNRQSSTKYSPFRLVYGLDARLPVDLEWDTPDGADHPTSIVQRAFQILNRLEPDRLKTYDNIVQAQARQKRYHDDQIEPRTYAIGDKVLLHRTGQSTSHSAKLLSKWDGPFYVHNIPRPGTYKLRTLDGRLVQNLAHGDRLKLYKERPGEPVVSIISSEPNELITTDNNDDS
jgi:hypothetical protein